MISFNIVCRDFRTIRISLAKEVPEEAAANFELRISFQTFNSSSMPPAFQIFKVMMETREGPMLSPPDGSSAPFNPLQAALKKSMVPSTPQTTWFTLPPKFRVPSSSFEEVLSSDFSPPTGSSGAAPHPTGTHPRAPSFRSPPKTSPSSLNILSIIQDAIDAKKAARTQTTDPLSSSTPRNLEFEKRQFPGVTPSASASGSDTLIGILNDMTPQNTTPVDRSEVTTPVEDAPSSGQITPSEHPLRHSASQPLDQVPQESDSQEEEVASPNGTEGPSPICPKEEDSEEDPEDTKEGDAKEGTAAPQDEQEEEKDPAPLDTPSSEQAPSSMEASPEAANGKDSTKKATVPRLALVVRLLFLLIHYHRYKKTLAAARTPSPRKPILASKIQQAAMTGQEINKPKLRFPRLVKNPLIGSMFDMESEMKRQGISAQNWRCTYVNAAYTFCPTYPAQLFVPATVSDEDLQGVKDFRTNGRIPALSWYNKKLGNVIMRSSQPNVGLYGKSSTKDQKLLEMTRLCAPNSSELVIFDARSKLAARGNKLKGFGTEDTTIDYKKCRIYFLALANIHAVRLAHDSLWQAIESPIAAPDNIWLSTLQESQWLTLIARLIASALKIAYHIEELGVSVLVHCSDGWDRTAQLTSLAEILLDPYYRTIEGFRALIEKNWLSFGHKFRDRNGDPTDPNLKMEQAPIFLQFVDSVWQLTQQFPSAFEFNNEYLLALIDHHNSGWFGTFLGNCERERVDARISETTFSLWDYLSQNPANFTNQSFLPLNNVLIPVGSIKVMRFWASYYLRYDKVFHIRFASKHEDEFGQLDGSEEVGQHRIVLWIPDDAVSQCHGCSAPFHFLVRRKHHCRNCGNIFCSSCVESRVYLKFLGYETPQKVCGHCYTLINLPILSARASTAHHSVTSSSRRNTLESSSDSEPEATVETKALKDGSGRSPSSWRINGTGGAGSSSSSSSVGAVAGGGSGGASAILSSSVSASTGEKHGELLRRYSQFGLQL